MNNAEFVDNTITELLESKAISEQPRKPDYVSPLAVASAGESQLYTRALNAKTIQQNAPLDFHFSLDKDERIELDYWSDRLQDTSPRTRKVQELQSLADSVGVQAAKALEDLLLSSRAPNTLKAHNRAMRDFLQWKRNLMGGFQHSDLDLAALYIALKSATASARTLATFVSALSYNRMWRKPHEMQQWTILDEMIQNEWLQLLDATLLMDWPQWRVDRAQILLTLLYCALLRISEAMNLEVGDIKEETLSWRISIRHSKTDQQGSGASVFLAKEPWFDDLLRRRVSSLPCGQLLCARSGGHWSQGAAATEIRRLCEKAGIRHLPPHAFRRGGATRALEQGISQDQVQRRGRLASSRSMKPYIDNTLSTQGGPADLLG
ncbi:site-specific recombinase, phage integrase family [Oesophagostomum dentatum]|uniref:Site-specific recombinase, phage integrase family n=1 Tax=Oesophagostomum dentatum TaxID=61180 RepID=A0A0B1TQG5_OESDE|nr:site-specific recombinase, phage integrase family [Oesophagostomum dentatum]